MSHIYAMSNMTTLVKIENKARKQRGGKIQKDVMRWTWESNKHV